MPRFPHAAKHLAAIPPSVYSGLAHRLDRFAGETYPLHVGDTFLEPPEGCRMEDLRVAEFPGMHRYAPVHGLPALLDALVERERRKTGLPLERENILVAAGATGGLGAVAGAILEPGDEVLILAPYWPLIEGIVRSFHGAPVAVPVDFGGAAPESPGSDTAASLVAKLEARRTGRTAALYFSTPNNPSGRILPRAWVEAMVEWARARDLWILSDEVYEPFLFQGEHTRALPLAPERTFLAQTFSKCYGMAGNRCGYMVGPAAVMAELRKVATHTFYSTPTAAQLAAVRALDGRGDAWAASACAGYEATARAAAALLRVPTPEGSTFLFFDVAAHLDERGLAPLLEACVERGLLIAPGPSFGPYPTHVRLCYTAVPPERALAGVAILAEILGR
ncbi:MAG: pyridoxal phosphate-dependent aminotransferase [Thermoanaerobaculia bacterium]|jgi:N-succinyldiaminopimelate aminotransferase|nr:pyridoxal phosphate-dependent aminotransferase [Thermoanaerobaculia bacterium]MBP9824444.1 pyridoxal phosphate-dependent aminotransferase [Thermoanaerobaculia bacterium]